jgi:hypothetical protein
MSRWAVGHCIETISSVTSPGEPTIRRVPLPKPMSAPSLVFSSSNSGHVVTSQRNDAVSQRTLRNNPRSFEELFHLSSINVAALMTSSACAAVRTGKTTEFVNSFSKGAK